MGKALPGRLPFGALGAIAGLVASGYLSCAPIKAQAQAPRICDQQVGYKLVPPAPDVSVDMRAFSGIWVGQWGNTRCSALVVESIEKDGSADVWYVFGPDSGASGRTGGANRRKGAIVGKTLAFKSGTASLEYQMVNTDELTGTFMGQGGQSRAAFRKQR